MKDKTIRLATFAVGALLAFLTAPTAAQAQRPAGGTGRRPVTASVAAERSRKSDNERMKGFSLGAYMIAAPGLSVTGNDMDGSLKTSFGPGAGVLVGYGFNRTWSGFASFDLAKQSATAGDYGGSFGLVHFEVGARANLPFGTPTNLPYVSASYGRRALGARVHDEFEGTNYNVSLTGGVFGLGGGIQHTLSPTLTLDGGMELGFGRFSDYEWDGDSGTADLNGSTSVRLKFGVTWRPSRSS